MRCNRNDVENIKENLIELHCSAPLKIIPYLVYPLSDAYFIEIRINKYWRLEKKINGWEIIAIQ